MRNVTKSVLPVVAALALAAASSVAVRAEDAKPAAGGGDLANQLAPDAEKDEKVLAEAAATKNENGKYLSKDGNVTFRVTEGGKKVDWYTYAGFRRYHADCHVCHGPEAMGSTYAPALKDSLKTIGYEQFVGIVAGGQGSKGSGGSDSVMPAFGENKEVMCHIDDLYAYIKGRAAGAVGRGRPAGREDKPEAYSTAEKACMGGS